MPEPSIERLTRLPDGSHDWEAIYSSGTDLPWDVKDPATELVEYFSKLTEADKPKNVIEVGCGTGSNALWLAKNGCKVTVTEISPTAMESAKARAKEANVSIDFRLVDICEGAPLPAGSQDFAFDRGVFHVIPAQLRAKFVQALATTVAAGGYWLSLAGSKDEQRENPEIGPPQLSAVELLEHIEPYFEVVELGRTKFILPGGPTHLAWKALYKRRK
jgi:SAM-dependent methyltransferase